MSLFENVKLLNKAKEEVDVCQELQDKVVAVFFSASWCLPSQEFVRTLAEMYKVLRQRQQPLQVVYVPCDQSEEEMWNYMTSCHGDWLTVPFKHPCISGLLTRYNVSAIPRVIVVRDSGEVISLRGRKELQDRGVAAFRAWYSVFKPNARVADVISMETGTPPSTPCRVTPACGSGALSAGGDRGGRGDGHDREGVAQTRNVTFKDVDTVGGELDTGVR